jgi:hypothetical protein
VSDPTDIKALDEYLKGGSDISQRYRELGREDVPPELDRRVLDEARTAVASQGSVRSRSWLRWSAPVALAASVVLVVTVVIESGVQDGAMIASRPAAEVREVAHSADEPVAVAEDSKLQALQETYAQSQSQPEPAAPPQVVPQASRALKTEAAPAANAAPDVPEEAAADAKVLRDQAFAGAPATVVTRPVALERAEMEADSSADLGEVTASSSRMRRATGRTAGPRSTVPTSALSSEARAAAKADADHTDPDKWLEEIRELRRTGKAEAADREWQLFREAFPDFRVADDDLARERR